ncbi:MAG TPA: (Fe-S)-binding protein [Desulfonatronum sp.]|nr:(Fe-S)-binding protein [Desulfonatronum sp.]
MSEAALAQKIDDPGLDETAAKLTPERIRTTINRVLQQENSARLKAFVGTCVSCGLCSDACHFFLSHDRDPKYSPAGKVKQTLWEMIRTKGNVSQEFIVRAATIAYTECNVCKRCVQYCPFGIDTAYLMTVVRRICHLLGVTPLYLQDTSHSHASTFNQMWVKDDEWIDTLQWQEDEYRDEIPNLRIPLEKEGADFFYSVIGPEPKFRTQLIGQAAVLMNECGVDWTMPATPGWDNSDMSMYSGDLEIMGRIKRAHFETARRLRVKRVVMGECGHAYRSVYDVGNRWLGWREMPIPVIHALQFYWEMLKEGRLKVATQMEEPCTFHDPCNVVRGMGLHEMARDVVRAFCSNFIEMEPNREQNYCCSAGGGVINCGPPHTKTRVLGNRVKAEQITATGAKVLIAPCHNCHGGLEDIINHYKLDVKLVFLIDIIYAHMHKSNAI